MSFYNITYGIIQCGGHYSFFMVLHHQNEKTEVQHVSNYIVQQ